MDDDDFEEYYERPRTYNSGIATGVIVTLIMVIAVVTFAAAFLLMI